MRKQVELRKNISKDDFRKRGCPGFVFIRRQRVMNCELHTHDFHEFVLVTSGSGYHVTKNAKFKIECGDVYLNFPGIPHGTCQCSNLEASIILFFPELTGFSFEPLQDTQEFQAFFQTAPHLSDSFRFRNNFHLEQETLNKVNALIKQMELEQQLRRPGWGFQLNSFFMQFLLSVLRSIFQNKSEEYRKILLINEITQDIEASRTAPASPVKLAKKFGLSTRSLERLFQETLNMTPIRYLGEQRLRRSMELLRNTSLPISEIALKTGFFDSAYFSKCFSIRFGRSPRSYRKMISGQ